MQEEPVQCHVIQAKGHLCGVECTLHGSRPKQQAKEEMDYFKIPLQFLQVK
jgi:hypothetical protein